MVDRASRIIALGGYIMELNCFQDIVMRIPIGCSLWGFAVQRLAEEGTISQEEVARYFDHCEKQCPLPDGVTENPTDMHPSEIYPTCNPPVNVPGECEDVETHTGKRQKNTCGCREVAKGSSLGKQLSLPRHKQVDCSAFMDCFRPVVTGVNIDEFGSGHYVTPDLRYALKYAGRIGVLWVFRTPDVWELSVWRSSDDKWKELTAFLLNLGLAGVQLPTQFLSSDVIIGPVSERKGIPRRA